MMAALHDLRDNRPGRILPMIILSQFAGTSLWFASNAIMADLQASWEINSNAVSNITSMIQFGFIFGTLLAAFFSISDRFSPRMIFLFSSLFGAMCNLLILVAPRDIAILLTLRFLTGIALAGIYPVGMKIASGWYRHGLGNALGFLVGALVLGTAFPHLLKGLEHVFHWQEVLIAVSFLAASGGVIMALFVPDGPYLTATASFDRSSLRVIFDQRDLRAAAIGYFGHMWELYAFYAFVPLILSIYVKIHLVNLNIPFWSFCIIGAGSIGCSAGGIMSKYIGSVRVASMQLWMSGLLCLASPLFFQAQTEFFLGMMILWGIVVVGDSPQFSALVARFAPAGLIGSALTITNSIGFAITIISIQCTGFLINYLPETFLLFPLFVGPLLGVFSMRNIDSSKH